MLKINSICKYEPHYTYLSGGKQGFKKPMVTNIFIRTHSNSNGCKIKNNCHNFNLPSKTQREFMNTSSLGSNMNIHSLNDEKEDQINKLSTNFQLLVGLDQMSEAKQRDHINSFMISLGRLFLNYFQYDLETAQRVGQKNQKILQDNIMFFLDFVDRTENILTDFESGEEWGSACIQRTRIDAFNEMFKGIVEPLDTEEIEDLMQKTPERHKGVDADKIPKNIPNSHWWWFV